MSTDAWALWREDPHATPFQSPAWLSAWSDHLSDAERVVAEVPGRAQLPLFVWNDAEVRKLVPVAAGQSDYCDMIGDPAAFPELLEAIAGASVEWDELVLPDLRPTSPLLGPLPPGWSAKDEPHEICPVMTLPAGRPLFEILSKSQRRKVVHDRYRADNLGGVTTALAGPEEIPEALDALFALHAARWGREGEPGVLADARVQAFHRAAAPALADAGLLRMAVVRHRDRIVAVLLGFRDAERFHSYINGVDFSVPGQSFGTLAFACLIDTAISEGAREFHFLRGEEDYKYKWGARPVQTVRRTLRRA